MTFACRRINIGYYGINNILRRKNDFYGYNIFYWVVCFSIKSYPIVMNDACDVRWAFHWKCKRPSTSSVSNNHLRPLFLPIFNYPANRSNLHYYKRRALQSQSRCHIHSKHVSYARQISIVNGVRSQSAALTLPLALPVSQCLALACAVNMPFFFFSSHFTLNAEYELSFYIVYVMLSMYNCQQPSHTQRGMYF